jgi:hypothetical protein
MTSNLLQENNPALAAEYTANNRKPVEEMTISSGLKAEWQCAKCDHVWEAVVASRSAAYGKFSSRGCPNCAGKVANAENSLLSLYPEIAKYYHPTRNKKPVEEMLALTSTKVWWICDEGHEYIAMPMNKVRQGDGCGHCSGRYATAENNLAVLNPELAKEFDVVKNAPKTAYDYTSKAFQEVWWLCSEGHSYLRRILDRNSGKNSNCWTCKSIGFLHPHLIPEFDTTKNDKTIFEYYAGGRVTLWWKCIQGHEWQALASSRTRPGRPTGCPDCVRNQTSDIEGELRDVLLEDDVIQNIYSGQNATLPVKWRTNSTLRVDILGEYKGKSVIVEYDGWYWHADIRAKEKTAIIRDTAKTQALVDAGYVVIRIREARNDHCLVKVPVKHPNLLQLTYNQSVTKSFTKEFCEEMYAWLAANF